MPQLWAPRDHPWRRSLRRKGMGAPPPSPPARRKEGKEWISCSFRAQLQVAGAFPSRSRVLQGRCLPAGREGGRRQVAARPPGSARRWSRAVARRGAPVVRPRPAGGLLPPGRRPARLPLPRSLPRGPAGGPAPAGPAALSPPPPPRAATGASRSRKLAPPPPPLSSPGASRTRCASAPSPGPRASPRGQGPRHLSAPLPAPFPLPAPPSPHGEGPGEGRARARPPAPPPPYRSFARHGRPGAAARPRRRGRPGP